jgi:CheY-like chemotaxis protein
VDAVQSFSVLVVDDDPSIRKMVIAALKRDVAGYTFAEAGNGRDALDVMRGQLPDVVVLDLMMPIVSGWDVLRERAGDEDLRKIPVIVVSANRDPRARHGDAGRHLRVPAQAVRHRRLARAGSLLRQPVRFSSC